MVEPTSDPFRHIPVMAGEVVALVADIPAGSFLDATLGGGGHAAAVLDSHPELKLIGIDQDRDAISAATDRLARFGDRVDLHRARFDRIGDVIDRISGFLFDLGVSSPQLDRSARGFSFRNDGPLDMRMDQEGNLSATDVVNGYEEARLARLLARYADERFAGRIARAIVAARPIDTTARLAQVVADSIPAPARRTGGHPARRTFQAIRIEVNDELRVLEGALETALDALVPGGRGLVLTYHSGEDRLVKDAFRRRTRDERPPGLPVEGPGPAYAVVRPMARRPSDEELERNPRAGSARLRAVERLDREERAA